MSTSNQTTDLSTANFTAIFDAASNEYKALTKQDLETHPFAAAFDNSNSPDSVMNIFRKQAQAFDKFRKGDDKLMTWLTPIVNILFTFSGTLGEGIGLPFSPAKTIFTGIGVLLGAVKDVIASYEALVKLSSASNFPSTSSSLHISPTHTGDDEAARENHGPDSLYSCTFDEDNEREAN
ncbi:hypothetical protein BGY98DRAFT_1096892 [Russula aff. rugulosa BPL654]|nr:hypothetical protein BGY98DRAFT_1096892 [Russula aff. rugulosa BPL654]